ncbi:hypothetical protein [Streptomyces sp. NPDC001530]|uniref:hypothetical protein n=1 Tax=Streptomyces sp. NPDC001530 TaxID=3364582 RepID=UPI003693BE6B
MHAIRVASAALLGVTALTFTAPLAAASVADENNVTPFGFSVQPSTIVAGGQVSLLLNRDDGRCKGIATVSSGVFDTVTLRAGQSSARTAVDVDARAGAVYEVTFRCDGVSGHTGLTIGSGRSDNPTVVQVPAQRGVNAGVGGTVDGFDPKEIGLGTALVAGSIGVAWYLARRHDAADDS